MKLLSFLRPSKDVEIWCYYGLDENEVAPIEFAKVSSLAQLELEINQRLKVFQSVEVYQNRKYICTANQGQKIEYKTKLF
jgi:hypothetical protein